MATILILDDDIGFLLWIGEALGSVGHKVVPALTPAAASRLQLELALKIDLLIVNPGVEGAVEFVRTRRSEEEHMRVMAVVEDGDDESVVGLPGIDAVQGKLEVLDNDSAARWLEAVRRLLSGNVLGR